ncbi:MAG: methyltransferase [Planctomyces sp.]|nr:methyltransferase [Planctomyces sp.]
MPVRDALRFPPTDATPIFDLFRGNFATELLAAAVAHLQVFELLSKNALSFSDLRQSLALSDRAANVLVTGLCAMDLLKRKADDAIELTSLARNHLVAASPFDISGYIGLAAQSPGTLALVERLKSDRPEGVSNSVGAAFIYKEGSQSAMEQEASARFLTLSLAGRAWNVAPRLADVLPEAAPGAGSQSKVDGKAGRVVLDVAGGSGIYTMALLQKHPSWRGVVFDRPEVLRTTAELAHETGLTERIQLVPGDMWADPFPPADDILLSNVLHDWDRPECARLVSKAANRLETGGRLLIHDVLLDDDLQGPLSIALYSLALFSLTEGRAYSQAEYRGWMAGAGLDFIDCLPTAAHGHLLMASKN